MNDRLLIGASRLYLLWKPENSVSGKEKKSRLVMRGGKTTLWRGGFFFCRFIGLERRVHHDNVLCGLARSFSSGYGKRTEQSAIRLLRMAVRWQWRKRAESSADKGLSFQSWQSPKKKITVEKTGKTIRDCRDSQYSLTFKQGWIHIHPALGIEG